jgi:hypothetical protein
MNGCVNIVDWLKAGGHDVFAASSGAWTALAAWIAVVVAIAALLYARRQIKRNRQQSEDLVAPNVAMYMEPNATDWHLVELVVKNYGRTPAHEVRFDFTDVPTVPRYENAYDGYLGSVPLSLPGEIPYLAPSQEWRTVWDSAQDRQRLGNTIESRFRGAVTYFDRPEEKGRRVRRKRRQYRSEALLDWQTLHPVERLELMTTHDFARQEKQKLELLRSVLAYYHNMTKESREDVLHSEIDRVNGAVEETRERLREQFPESSQPKAQVPPRDPYEYHEPATNGHHEPDDYHEPATELINGRHHRDLPAPDAP